MGWQACPITTCVHAFKVRSRVLSSLFTALMARLHRYGRSPGPTATLTLEPGEKYQLWLVLAYGANLTLAASIGRGFLQFSGGKPYLVAAVV